MPSPVSEVTTHKFRGSPPFVQVLFCALIVVMPAICDVKSLVLIDTVALTVAEIDGTEAVMLPSEDDGNVNDESEIEDNPGRFVSMLVEGRLEEVEVSSSVVGRVTPESTEELGRLKVVSGTLTDV